MPRRYRFPIETAVVIPLAHLRTRPQIPRLLPTVCGEAGAGFFLFCIPRLVFSGEPARTPFEIFRLPESDFIVKSPVLTRLSA